jgi:hypothetical protein
MIGVLPNLHAQSIFGICLALKLLLKVQVNSRIPWAGLQTYIVCAIHPPPSQSLITNFEAGLHDIYN